MESKKGELIHEILPKSGLVYSERGGLVEILCKPKIMPMKSSVMEKLKKFEQNNDAEESKSNLKKEYNY